MANQYFIKYAYIGQAIYGTIFIYIYTSPNITFPGK